MSPQGPPSPKLLDDLRSALVGVLAAGSWTVIETNHKKVGLAWREDLKPGWGKPRYVGDVLAALSPSELIALGGRCCAMFADTTGQVQNALWWIEADGLQTVSELTRFGLADSLDGRRFHPREPPLDFLRRVLHVSAGAFLTTVDYDAHGRLYKEDIDLFGVPPGGPGSFPEIRRQPYTHRELLGSVGLGIWSDKRLFTLLEALVHPNVRRGLEQQELVEHINALISADGWTLAETERISNHPVFSVRRRDRGVDGHAKNLIFASTGPKPELGFRDAINNDIVILKHADHCLIYDEPLSDQGLLWNDLVAWWRKRNGGNPDDKDARRRLGERLQAALGSPAEASLFRWYFRVFVPILGERLPALIPQVYLHYDPVTIRSLHARGDSERFPVQRMDFLLLLPHAVRAVVEVDGQQHYSEVDGETWRPSPTKYATTLKGDRDLRLMGYEVYRFGGHELRNDKATSETVSTFFERLFVRHKIS